MPQAVFKISSYSYSAAAVWQRVQYVSREGELRDQAQLAQMVEEWDAQTGARARRQFAMSAVVSFPKGVDEAQATEAARQFFRAAFAENHDYVFAPHTDAKQFHVHVVVQSAGHDRKQLRIRRDDLQDLRLLLAEKAHEQGIELDASPRWARGLDAERRPGPEVEGIQRRGETPALGPGEAWSPELELTAAGRVSPERRIQLEALVEVRRARDPDSQGVTAEEYVQAAEGLARKIGALEESKEKVAAVKGAAVLAEIGLQRAASLRSSPNHDDKEAAQARARFLVTQVERVEKAINAQIRGLGSGAAQHEAITARRGLAEQISQYHQGAREQAAPAREARPESAPARDACQALEYARDAAGLAGHISELTTDKERVAAVKASVSLARFGWDLAHTDRGTAEEREEARGEIDKTERALRFAINRIEDPQAKRAAIQARQTLYQAGVKEYRAERREREWAERAAEEARDTGPELEP